MLDQDASGRYSRVIDHSNATEPSMHNITAFDVVSNIVVIGTNPEMADYSNPRGHIHGLAFAVRASNDNGDTWEQHVVTGPLYDERDMQARAERLASALQARLDRLGKLPVDAARWVPGRAVYGSPAWEQYGNDEELALERREAADEAFGAFPV